jgi:hypothetical protein
MSILLPNPHAMNAKTTVLLLLALLVIGGYVYFFELDNLTTREREQRPAGGTGDATASLLDPDLFSLDAVRRIEIVRNGASMTFARHDAEPASGAAWRQTEPVRFPLQRMPVEDLIRAAVDLRIHQRITPGEDAMPSAAELGFGAGSDTAADSDAGEQAAERSLSPVALTRVTLTTGTGELRTIELGKRSMQGRAYVRFADESGVVYVVDDALHRAAVGVSSADFRLRRTEPQGFDVPGQADRVTLERDGETIELHRIDGRWFLSERATERADADAADAVARAAGELRIEGFVTDEADSLASYGLASPSLRVAVAADLPAPMPDEATHEATNEADAEGETDLANTAAEGITRTHEVRVGGPADLDSTRFFAQWTIDGEASSVVFTVSDASLEPLRVSVDELRDPAVVLTEPGAVSELRLDRGEGNDGGDGDGDGDGDGPSETLHLDRREAGAWRFGEDTSVDFAPDREAVNAWLSSVTGLSSTSFAPPPAGEPVMRLRLYAGGRTEEIRFHESGDDLLAVRNNETIAYRLDDQARETLTASALSLRARTLLNLDPAELSELRLTQPDGADLTFRRRSTDTVDAADPATAPAWKLLGQESFETAAFETLLDRLTPLRAERWLDESVTLADAGTIGLTLVPSDGPARTLRIDPETRRATADFVDAAFVLPQTLINAANAELQDRTVLSLPAERIASVAVDRVGEASFTLRRLGDGFASDAGEVNPQAAATLFDRIAGLRVERHVTGDVGQRELSTLGITTTDGAFHEIMLAEPFDQTRTLHFDDRGWYRVSESVAADLIAPLLRSSEQP